MKATLFFKTPDVLDQLRDNGLSKEEITAMIEFIKKYVQYGENVKIRFDSESNTVTVLPVSGR